VSLPMPSNTYAMDLVHSQIAFSVRHLGISSVRGTFDQYSGALFVGDTLEQTTVTFEAEMASVNSGNRMRDEHIHNADFFDVENHPTMNFHSTSITADGDHYRMAGKLAIKGVTRDVEFVITYNGAALFPMDNLMHHGFTGTGTISRSAFGVSYGVPLVSDEVELWLDVQFIAPTAE